MTFKRSGFDDMIEAIELMDATLISIYQNSKATVTEGQQRIQCSAQCNAKNHKSWECIAFYIPNSTSCAVGFLPIEYVLDFRTEPVHNSGQVLYVLEF